MGSPFSRTPEELPDTSSTHDETSESYRKHEKTPGSILQQSSGITQAFFKGLCDLHLMFPGDVSDDSPDEMDVTHLPEKARKHVHGAGLDSGRILGENGIFREDFKKIYGFFGATFRKRNAKEGTCILKREESQFTGMQVTFLGTNGWYDSSTGNTVSTLISTRDYDIILDAGNGIAKADRYMSQDKPVFLFLSHFHLDHTEGLHVLVKFRFKKGLTICGQIGTTADLAGLVREPYTVPLEQVPFAVTVTELADGVHELPFKVTCLPLVHPVPCRGFRFEIDGKVITYCTDTGICDNAITLARGADLLITECGLKPGQKSPGWPHLNPEDAIHIAKAAKVKRLALMHFGAEVYHTIEERRVLKVQFGEECPGLVVAEDGMTVDV